MQRFAPPLTAKEILRLPFDQYQRYRLVTEVLGRIRDLRHPLRILDVGGRTALLRSFLPEDDVTLVDLESSEAAGLVLGDGSKLPFADAAFDVVTGCDTLEHIPPDMRRNFVSECVRVSHGYVLLAGPYGAPEVDEAEELLDAFLENKLGLKHRYLREHREFGLPDRALVEGWFEGLGARVLDVGHGRLERWLALMCMAMYMDDDPLLRPMAGRFFAFYNERMFWSDHGPSVYRHAVVAAVGSVPLPDLDGMFSGGETEDSPVATASALAQELVAFDREQEAWRPEIERLKGVIAGLEADRDGHREKLAETEHDLAGHRSRLAATEGDLREHVATVAELRELMAAERAAFEEVRDELMETLAEKERQRGVERAAEKDVADKLSGEAELLRAETQKLKAELEAHVEHRDALVAELEATHEEAAEVQARLSARVEYLENELRPRLKNLKRALKLNKFA